MKHGLTLVIALTASALSWPAWLVRGGWRDFLGLNEANVQDAYRRLAGGWTLHDLNNLSSEWARSGEERASKTLAAAVLWPWLIALVAWLA